ncbi:NADPH-dependent FMN reductase [Pseudomonas syringae]|uniref:NADPH-dependent FMN reductase n=1 Tax=Pseudomonas syringae TaxID=317 RepID=UPI0018E629E3|nr:NADPH-dependent FMN reductase [Pseudomonas syringae]MBI6750931.1 NAD(P)H-dependent oxidoreductase [Pseudomonas syringae]MBI6769252.1 NAD(P)H-dependent oxidoreductase [Pseudomonas syringae]MBI6778571.1 NAD(P)H-dependent oxidoreductase [Pseudomonas syringae]MBI6793744.1 NAD(P)H-dependent oxidoreductase [Pseudomonas syringae]MBI6804475.1 NAD(P)H-dependent oxidoreductase [Pseudomonas syringae]
MKTIQLLGLCGSLRQQSSNSVVLQTLSTELLPPNVKLDVYDLKDIPLYNADLDGDDPPVAVRGLRTAVRNATGLVIASPEYSHCMSGVIKNALDWLSSLDRPSALKGKPTLTITASPTFTGGSRAQHQLGEALWAVRATVINFPPVLITEVSGKIRNGRLMDEVARATLTEAAEVLVEASMQSACDSELIWA